MSTNTSKISVTELDFDYIKTRSDHVSTITG
jgi:hypothetical protein